MKTLSFMHQRLQLLALGESLGWPRLPVGRFPVIRAGQSQWERAARGQFPRIAVALRYAKIRSDNAKGGLDTEQSRVVTYDIALREESLRLAPARALADKRREALAKGRATRLANLKAKKEAALAEVI